MNTRILPVAVLLLGLSVSVQAQDSSPLSTLKQRYERLSGLRASFTQVMGSEFSSDSSLIQGRVVLAENKYRVETPAQTVVTNGETTWIYSPADSQVVVNDAESAESTVTPQSFLMSSTQHYSVASERSATRDGVPHSVLTLAGADDNARFEDVTLWIRTRDSIVTRLRATDRNGSTLDLRLRDIVVNPTFPGDPFVFSAPDGVEVVDLRSDASD